MVYSAIMKNFQQWHDGNVFHSEMNLTFGRCDRQHRLNLSELLLVTSDTAIEDFHQRGMTFDVLQEHSISILVSRVSFHINRYPLANDRITVTTWEDPPEGIQLSRRYELTDHTGETLVSGTSTWLIVNPGTRRIMKPSQFTLREPPVEAHPFSGIPCGKIVLPDHMEKLDERIIRYTDIDANGHMNNARYGAYIIDCLPAEYQSKNITDFRINYSHEAMIGDTLQLQGNFENPQKIIIAGKAPSGICFESELYYT